MVDCNPCLLMCRCPIVVSLDFSKCFLMIVSVRPGHVFRKPYLISFRRLAVFGLKSAAYKYRANCGFEVCDRMLFTTFSGCCGPRGTSHITVLFFLVPLIISCPLSWMDIACLYSVIVHPSSHKAPNDINGSVYIFGKFLICLACLLRPGIWSVAIYVDSIVLPFSSLAFISFSIFIEAIVGVACLAKCIFAPESAIAGMLVIFGLGGVSI